MYIHLGGDYTISSHLIVGIFDLDQVTLNPSDNATMDFLRHAEELNLTEMISPEVPRSLVVTLEKVLFSPIAASTLRQRWINPLAEFRSGLLI